MDNAYYVNNVHAFPSNDIPKEEKGAEWHLRYAKAILSLYYRNRGAIMFSEVEDIIKNRKYAIGQQDITRIKNQFNLGSEPEAINASTPYSAESARKGMANVNWEVVSEIPKLLSIITGIALKEKTTIGVYAADERSTTEKQKRKWDIWLASEANKVVRELGVGEMEEQVEFQAESVEELEMFASLGGVKMAIEVNLQKAISMVFRDSNWDEELVRKIIFELFANNMAATKDYVDIDGRVKTRIVDIAKAIYEYSPTYNYTDMQFAGEVVMRSIKEIRLMTDIPEQELYTIARTSADFSILASNISTDYTRPNADGSYLYDSFRIPVLECEFLNTNCDFYKTKTDKRGIERTFKEDYIKNFDESKGKAIKRISELTVQKCSYIIGTEHIYDWGEVMAGAPGEKPRLSFNFVRIEGPSMVNRLIPLADAYYLNWVKFQNALAMAPPAGLAYEWDSISNMMLGGGKLKPRDFFRMRMQGGNVPYKSSDPFGRPTGHLPFQELEGGIGRQFDEFFRSFELFDALTQRITGFTDIAAAVSPGERQGKAVTEMSYEATINALFPILNRVATIKKMVAETSGYTIQAIARSVGYETYYQIFGENTIEILNLGKEEGMARIGITMIPIPTTAARSGVLEAAQIAMQSGKNGVPLITMADYLFIKRMLDMENIRLAEMYLVYKEAKTKQQQEMVSQQTIAAQAQAVIEQEKQKLAFDVERDAAFTDNKIKLEYYKAMFAQDSSVNETERAILMEYAKSLFASLPTQSQ